MIQIRKNVFETNSSSTHSIAISKEQPKNEIAGRHIHFGFDEYGWDHDYVYNTEDYLYTAIISFDVEKADDMLKRLRDSLDRMQVTYEFEPIKKESSEYGSWYEPEDNHVWAGVDHGGECLDLIEALLSDDDLLARYLFSPESCVYTGNDNDCEGTDMCYCAEPTIYDYDEETREYINIPNPNHDSEHYDYFFKGN